jgi:hypothetical protein
LIGKPGTSGCGRSFTRAEALRRHQKNLKHGTFCQKLPEQDELIWRPFPGKRKRKRKSNAYAVELEESSGNLIASLVDADHEEIAEQQRSDRGRTTVDTGIADIGSSGRTSPSTMQLQEFLESLTNLDLITSHILQEKPKRVALTSSQHVLEQLENYKLVLRSLDDESHIASGRIQVMKQFLYNTRSEPSPLYDLADIASGDQAMSGINPVALTSSQHVIEQLENSKLVLRSLDKESHIVSLRIQILKRILCDIRSELSLLGDLADIASGDQAMSGINVVALQLPHNRSLHAQNVLLDMPQAQRRLVS